MRCASPGARTPCATSSGVRPRLSFTSSARHGRSAGGDIGTSHHGIVQGRDAVWRRPRSRSRPVPGRASRPPACRTPDRSRFRRGWFPRCATPRLRPASGPSFRLSASSIGLRPPSSSTRMAATSASRAARISGVAPSPNAPSPGPRRRPHRSVALLSGASGAAPLARSKPHQVDVFGAVRRLPQRLPLRDTSPSYGVRRPHRAASCRRRRPRSGWRRAPAATRDVVMAVDDGYRQRRRAVRILSVQVGACVGQGPRRVHRALARREHQRGEAALRWRQRRVRRQVVPDVRGTSACGSAHPCAAPRSISSCDHGARGSRPRPTSGPSRRATFPPRSRSRRPSAAR